MLTSSSLFVLLSRRLALLKRIEEISGGEGAVAETVPDAKDSPRVSLEAKRQWWKQRLSRGPPQTQEGQAPALTNPLRALASQRSPRSRRHAHHVARAQHHHHKPPQLMRVGCVLGTCQVQNLSHRLYQLIGQSGRQDSAPMNPQSPHSYG